MHFHMLGVELCLALECGHDLVFDVAWQDVGLDRDSSC
jgi:hypothetical protein